MLLCLFPVPEWWLNKDLAGGGALLDLGYHLIDLLSWLLGDFDVAYSNLGHIRCICLLKMQEQ